MKEIKKILSRYLRKNKTKTENKAWQYLRDKKFNRMKFRRQYVIEGFVVDFFCKEHNIAIEVDGGIHNRRKDYDTLRQDILESEGIKVIRITNEEIERDIRLLLNKIERHINK